VRIRTVAVVLLVMLCGVGLGCYGTWLLLMPAALRPPPPQPVCVARAGSEARLEPEQMANAATIAGIGVRRRLPLRAVQVALVTALQESKLRNLSGGDRDSVGLFQQRPSQGWGQPQQLIDIRFATNAFYTALVKIHEWQAMSVGDAAQAVQHSAYPEAYVQWTDTADILARALTEQTDGAVACTVASASEPHGAAAVGALTAGLRADWGETGVTTGARADEVAVRATDPLTAWRYAYWAVSHVEECGIEQVRVGDLTWKAVDGRWTRTEPGAAGSVIVRVHNHQ
jgi:hypothetical protein